MSAVDEYSKRYPDAWEVAGQDPEGFLASLAEAGVIESRMIVPLLAQHRLAQKITPPPVPEVPTVKFKSRVAEWRDRHPEISATWPGDDQGFIEQLLTEGEISEGTYRILLSRFERPPTPELSAAVIWKEAREEFGDVVFDKTKEWFKIAYHEVLVSLWKWMLEKMKELVDLVVGFLKPVLERAWEFAKAKLEEGGRKVFDGLMKIYEGHSPIRPEDAPALAGKMYLFAMAAGTAAHGVSTVFELLHPLKRIGLHQTAALIGELAGFGRITGATIGPLVTRVLGQAMTYAVQDRYRPRIPDERLLIEFRSKREIDKAQFDKAIGYQGYSKEWTDIIERWQWKDPRMFELMRVADIGIDQGPPPASEAWWFKKFGITGDKLKDWWLYRKLMRAGYEDVDLDVLVNTIHRREISFAMTYVRTAVRRNYRWGYLTDKELGEWIDRLLLPEQAKEWIFWAGQLDREYFYRQDLVAYYKTAFRNDVIDDDELLVSLLSMGLPAREATIMVRTEKIKKVPKVRQATEKASEKALSDVQKKYITLYLEQFRKGLIGESKLLESLLAIGITADLAEVTVQLEATKKSPAAIPA